MEIKHAMNISTATLQAQINEGKISITDATAVFAWSETRDEAAAQWLCAKYRPMVAQIVSREVRDAVLRGYVIDDALRVALMEMDTEMAATRADAWFALIAKQVSQQSFDYADDCELLAA